MPLPRYEREEEATAGPRFTRGILKLYGFGLLIGLLIALGWIVAGLLKFHVLR
jgi:hypothetical protein